MYSSRCLCMGLFIKDKWTVYRHVQVVHHLQVALRVVLTEVLVGRVHRIRFDTVDETVGVPRNAGVGLTVVLSDVHRGSVERDLGLLHLTVAISDVSVPEKSHVGPFCSRSAKEPGLSELIVQK